jgi:hypothetical protein
LPEFKQSKQQPVLAKTVGATQVSSLGVYAKAGECESPAESADYVVSMTGDLAGCLYTYVDDYECSPAAPTVKREENVLLAHTKVRLAVSGRPISSSQSLRAVPKTVLLWVAKLRDVVNILW